MLIQPHGEHMYTHYRYHLSMRSVRFTCQLHAWT